MHPEHDLTVTVAGATGTGKTNVALMVIKLLQDNGFVVDHDISPNEDIHLDGTEGTIVKIHEVNLLKSVDWDTPPEYSSVYSSAMTRESFEQMYMNTYTPPRLGREETMSEFIRLLNKDTGNNITSLLAELNSDGGLYTKALSIEQDMYDGRGMGQRFTIDITLEGYRR